MNRMVKKLMVVLMSVFMFMGTVTTPVQAKGPSVNTNSWNWFGWWWTQPSEPEPEPEVTEEPVIEEEKNEPVEEETTETPAEEEAPAIAEELASEESSETVDPIAEETPDEAEPEVNQEVTELPVETEEVEYPAYKYPTAEVENVVVDVEVDENVLPAGTELKVTPITDEDALAEIEEAASVSGSIAAVDISFHYNGTEIEPKGDVKVTIGIKDAEIDPEGSYSVIHVDDDMVATEIAEEKVEVTEEGVTFANDEFSIYLIVDGDNPDQTVQARATYHFLSELNADGTAEPYTFVNKHGETVDYQIVKNDELLDDPGSPAVSLEKNFLGWFVVEKNGDTYSFPEGATAIDFSQTPPVKATTITGDLDVYVAPRYGKAFIVTFWDNAKGTDEANMHIVAKKVVYLDEGKTTASVRVDDVPVPTIATHALSGWTSDDYKTGEETTYTLLEKPYWDEVTQSFSLYPIFSEGHWLRFSGGPAGSGAGYRTAIFVTTNTTASELLELGTVARDGYTFAGWYYDGFDGTEAATSASGRALNAADLLNRINNTEGDTTLYAHWSGDQVKYRVVTWFQNANDDKYSFGAVSDRTGEAGTTTNVTASTVQYYTPKEIEQKVIKGDGTTVVDVYYDRTVYELKFEAPTLATPNTGSNYQQQSVYIYDSENGTTLNRTTLYSANGKWYTYSYYYGYNEYTAGVYSNNSYSEVYTISARWGADISDQFPIVGNNGVTYDHGERWKPQNNGVGWSEVMLKVMTMPTGNVTFRLSYPKRPVKTMNYKVEALPTDTGTTAAPDNLYIGRSTVPHSSSLRFKDRFTLKANYQGVTAEDLLTLEGFELLGLSKQADTNGHYIWNDNNDNIDIYYTRKQYFIHFDTQKASAADPDNITDIYYEANIATTKADEIANLNQLYKINETKIEVTGEGAFVFRGWYDNAACMGDPFDFDVEMPAGNIELFAKWEPITYLIQIDPKGGEILPDINEVTYTWLPYGKKIERYTIRRDYVEANASYTGDKYYYVSVLAKDDPNARADSGAYSSSYRKGFYIKTTDINEEQYKWWMENGFIDTSTEYMPATTNDNFAFVGWYRYSIDPITHELTETNSIYDFNETITGETAIYAKWRRSGLFTVQYHTENGTVSSQIDGSLVANDSSYADLATTQIAYTPTHVTSTDGKAYVFVGWKLADPNNFDAEDPGSATLGDTIYEQGDDFIVDAGLADSGHYIHLVACYEPAETNPDTLPVTTVTFDPNFPAGATETDGEKVKVEGVPLNTAIDLSQDIFTITLPEKDDRDEPIPTYTCYGYEQIGWNTEADGSGVSYKMNDIVGVDNADPIANTLYAVWDKTYFYVFHSSNSELQAIAIVDLGADNFDLVSNKYDHTLYGGYYSAYLGLTETSPVIENAKKAALAEDSKKATVNVPAYNGYDLTAKVENKTTKYWVKSNACADVKGDSIPVSSIYAGKVFFLKEVSENYLTPYMEWVYDFRTKELISLYAITVVDDTYYTEVGLELRTNVGKYVTKLSSKFTFYRNNESTYAVTVNAKTVNAELKRGYVGVENATDALSKIEANTDYELVPYWITLDGVTVYTAASKTYNFGTDKLANQITIK